MDTFRKRENPIDASQVAFRGGAVTVRPRALIPFGSFSVLQNVRGFHPGFRKRDGQTKLSTTSELATKQIDLPEYNAGAANYASGYAVKAAASWAGARDAATADSATMSTEHANTCIVKESGGTYTVGRTFLFFDLSRLRLAANSSDPGSGVISSASLYIKLNGATNLSSIIAKGYSGSDPDLNSSDDPFAAADWDEIGSDYSAEVSLTGSNDGDWIEIALNSTAITEIEAGAGQTDETATMAIVLREYTHDDQDSAPGSGETHDCRFYTATSGSLPYLKLTMSTPEEPMKLFQWSKGKREERHLFLQVENGDLIEATEDMPGVSSGDFGTVVHQPRDTDGSFNPWPVLTVGHTELVPASFGNADDTLIYSDGLSQHMAWTGEQSQIESFVIHKGTGALADNPQEGFDYSLEASDNDPETYVDLSSLGDEANDYDAFFIKTKFKAHKFNFTIRTGNGNTTVLHMATYDKAAGWQERTITDGTSSGGSSMSKNGSVTWTEDAEEIEFYAFGENGYWYKFWLDSGDSFDADTTVSSVTYEGPWQEVENVWNGVLKDAREVYYYDDSADIFYNYPFAGVELDELDPPSDLIYFSSDDNLVGVHVDLGAVPNLSSGTTVSDVEGWDGDSWVSVTDMVDDTNGFNDSGFITWKRNANFQPREFNGSQYSAYWWRITFANDIFNDDVVGTFRVMPWFDINELGSFGRCNTVWKERGVYSFDNFPSWLYVSENNEANRLNGADFAVLQAGDGRRNKIVAMQKFHNELMVWQQERGRDGGCLTLFEGYNPATFGKLLLSAKIGTFSQKSVVVIDGANSYTRADDNVQTLAFFISHYGIYVTDGSVVTRISDDIQNYFDLRFSECIRRGYEDKMYVEHDTSANVLRFGLVSGSTATQCNIFPVFDLVDWTWSFDVIGQNHTHVHEVEASSGQFPVLQIASATNGYVYKINDTSTDQDDGTNIDMDVRPEFNSRARNLKVGEVVVRMFPVTDGELSFSAYEDGDILADATETIEMDSNVDGKDIVRHRILIDVDQHSNVSLRFRNNRDEDCYLYDYLIDIKEEIDR